MVSFELKFDLRAMTSKNLVRAELHVLKKRATEGEPLRCEYSVMVHSFIGRKNPTKTLIDSLKVKNSLKGQWLTFNVTAALRMIIHGSERKLGFRLSTDGAACAKCRIGKKGRHRPFLVTYTRDGGDKSSQTILSRIGPGSKQAKPFLVSHSNRTVNDRKSRAIKDVYCRRRRLRVHFRELKWNRWIIAPRSYWANYCEGTCPRVPVYPFDVSNHAILQNILRHHASCKDIPSALCVPTQLNSLAMLFRDWKDNSIVLKEFPDMAVSACGCR
ncbi:bone morphogenetic protein 7-like [Oculina patagonica]